MARKSLKTGGRAPEGVELELCAPAEGNPTCQRKLGRYGTNLQPKARPRADGRSSRRESKLVGGRFSDVDAARAGERLRAGRNENVVGHNAYLRQRQLRKECALPSPPGCQDPESALCTLKRSGMERLPAMPPCEDRPGQCEERMDESSFVGAGAREERAHPRDAFEVRVGSGDERRGGFEVVNRFDRHKSCLGPREPHAQNRPLQVSKREKERRSETLDLQAISSALIVG